MKLYHSTPTIFSPWYSEQVRCDVWLKMEALQATGSFKARGISVVAQEAAARGAKTLVASSGGNAGLAVAYCAAQLGLAATVVVPESTPQRAIDRITRYRAHVIVHGSSWQEAHELAQTMLTETCQYVHPFDNPLLWEGHASIMHEVADHLPKPDLIVLSVGGGGLLCGVCRGLREVGWEAVPLLAVETRGAASLRAALEAGALVSLREIDTVAVTLGAKQIAQQALHDAQTFPVTSRLVTDYAAVTACLEFANEHRIIVEPACGAALAAISPDEPLFHGKRSVLVIVCGGSGTSYPMLQKLATQLAT